MKTRDTALGLLVLGLVIAGVFWARGLPPLPSASAGRVSPSPSTSARHGDDRDRGDTPATAAVPDVTAADGTVDLGDVRMTLSATPRPPVAFAKIRFGVRVESNGVPVALEGGRISFEMTMPMGEHRYALVPGADGWQVAEVVLPMCRSGHRRWYAFVEGTVRERPTAARFRFDMTKPDQRPLFLPTP